MRTLDRYIARQYLFNVLALVVLLFTFVVAIDVMLNLDDFMDRAEKIEAAAEGGGQAAVKMSFVRKGVLTALLVFDLWWPRLLQLYNYTIGLCLVGAMGFTFTQLVRHREVVAILAGGISLYRVLLPVMAVAGLMMAVKVVNQEMIISHPRIAPLLARTPADAGNRELTEFQVPLTADSRGQVWFARTFEPRTATLSDVVIWQRDSRGIVTARISAEEAVWREPAGGAGSGKDGGNGGSGGAAAGAGWELRRARFEAAEPMRPGSGGGTVRREGAGEVRDLRIETDLEPATLLFRRFASFRQSLSWMQIGQMLDSPDIKPELRDQLQRIRWARVSTILSGLLSLAITMPFFLMREPRNMLVQSLKCAPVAIVTVMGGTLLAALPIPGLPAGFAVFLPVLVLLPIAVAVLGSMRT